MQPRTSFARSGDLYIADQVVGGGPLDLVFAPAYSTHLELNWEWPAYAGFLHRVGPSRLMPTSSPSCAAPVAGGFYRQGVSSGHEDPRAAPEYDNQRVPAQAMTA
jgi:hypothetical protein